MPIRVTCSKCHTRFNVSEKFAGKEGPCPKCKTVIKVPSADEEVVIQAPTPKGPVDSQGRSILRPIRRRETSLSGVQITLIVASIVGFLAFALVMRFLIPEADEFPVWLLGVSTVVLAVPLVFVAYAFLRDQDRASFFGRELWVRVAICSLVYAATWAAMPLAAYAFDDSYEVGSYVLAGCLMFGIGTVAAMFTFDLDAMLGAVHYGLYMGVGLVGRWLAGLGIVPVNPAPPIPTTAPEVTLLEWAPVCLDLLATWSGG